MPHGAVGKGHGVIRLQRVGRFGIVRQLIRIHEIMLSLL